MKINPQNHQIENIFALITDSNPSVISNGFNLRVNPPTAVTDVEGYNTSIVIDGVPKYGYKGAQTFFYNRLLFSAGQGLDASNLGPITVDPDAGEYGALLKAFDSAGIPPGDGVIATSINMPSDVNTPGSITLNVTSDSFLYLQAEPVTIVLQFPAA